jgi:hypothetical protein
MPNIQEYLTIFYQHPYFWQILVVLSVLIAYLLYYWRFATPHFLIKS